MAVELQSDEFGAARSLFADLAAFQLSTVAVIDGEMDGRLLVDDPVRPRSGLMTSPEGAFLAGIADNTEFNDALSQFVRDELFGRLGWQIFYVTTDSAAWLHHLATLAKPGELSEVERRYYVCEQTSIQWRALVPDGFSVRPIDAALLSDAAVSIPDHVRGWIASNWQTQERFLDRGFGFAAVRGGELLSWSLADCLSAGACEIGIHTSERYRRRGLATVTAAAAVEHALASGLRAVGWHCNEDNLGSIRTAERVGFTLERRYLSHYLRAPATKDA